LTVAFRGVWSYRGSIVYELEKKGDAVTEETKHPVQSRDLSRRDAIVGGALAAAAVTAAELGTAAPALAEDRAAFKACAKNLAKNLDDCRDTFAAGTPERDACMAAAQSKLQDCLKAAMR
jgi:hypothetical protein